MMRTLLLRGMAAGLVAGILAFLWVLTVGEPSVRAAIAVEEAASAGVGGHVHEEAAAISRGTQETYGLGVGLIGFSAAIGGFLALVFALVYARLSTMSARNTVMAICGLGFLAIGLVPLTKYPANPPAVGSAGTITERTEWFFVLLVIAILAVVAAVNLGRQLSATWGVTNACFAAGLLFVVMIGVAHVALPNENEVQTGFPPQVLWDFRLANLGTQAVIWTTLAFGFGLAVERAASEQRAARDPGRTRGTLAGALSWR